MSARLLMRRIFFIVVVLALLVPALASGSPAAQAKAHRKTPAASTAHSSHHATRSVHHTRTSVRSHKSQAKLSRRSVRERSSRAALTRRPVTKTHRPTPEQVGHAAGLKIRRELQARKAVSSRRYVSRRRRSSHAPGVRRTEVASRPTTSASRSLRSQRTPSNEADDAGRAGAPAMSAASTSLTDRDQPDEVGGPEAGADATGATPVSGEADALPPAEPSVTSGSALLRAASLHVGRGGMPPPLRGSLASLVRQNQRLDAEGLERILDEDDLASRIAHRLLVPVPVSDDLTVNQNLTPTHRYCRPWTAQFLRDLASAHAEQFGRPLEVTSAVRTVEYQKRLMRINGNATAAQGEIVSPHETGSTIDIGKKGMGRQELAWMRSVLLALQNAGKIDVEEEFQQACFHVTVYKSYMLRRRAPMSAPAEGSSPSTIDSSDTAGELSKAGF